MSFKNKEMEFLWVFPWSYFGKCDYDRTRKENIATLIESGKLKFYMRYFDDVLLSAKEDGKVQFIP